MKDDDEMQFKEIAKNHILNHKKIIYISDFWSILYIKHYQ